MVVHDLGLLGWVQDGLGYGLLRVLGYVALHYALIMLDYLQAVSMLGLIVGHVFLIRGCFSIREAIGSKSGSISESIDKNSGLLDELIQVVVDVIPEGPSSSGIAQAPSGIGDLLTMFLNNRMSMGQNDSDGDTTQDQWEVLPNENDKTTPEANA